MTVPAPEKLTILNTPFTTEADPADVVNPLVVTKVPRAELGGLAPKGATANVIERMPVAEV